MEKRRGKQSHLLFYSTEPKMTQAILKGEIHTVKHLILNGEDVNHTDIKSRSYLHLAAFLNAGEIAKILIAAGARVNCLDGDWYTPMHRACRMNHDSIVSLLIEKDADVNRKDRNWVTPLHVCAANNALECARLFIDKVLTIDATDKNGHTALHHAAFNGHCDLILFLLSNGAKPNSFDKLERRPIHFAAAVDNTDAIRLLVDKGGQIDVRDREMLTPLHIAATKGCLNAIQILVEIGANINCVDANGNTPLHWACLNGQDDVIDELIASGACINAMNRTGITPLHYAAASKSGTPALEVLMRHKDNLSINARDKSGRTPLHLAAKFGRMNRVLDLIRYGADLAAVDDNQMLSALHYAAKGGHCAVIETLIAQPNIDLKAEDRHGNNSLHYACIFKKEDVGLRLLEKCPYLVNSTNCDLKTPLHIAAANGLYNLTHKLLLAGASVTAGDINNHTPSLCCAKNSDVAECLTIIETVMIMEEINKKSSFDGVDSTMFSPNPRESRHSFLNGVCTQLFSNSSFESSRSSLERPSSDDDKSFEDARQSFENNGSECIIGRKSPLSSSITVTKIVANNHDTNENASKRENIVNDSDFF